jgi:hypothetical protein
VTTNLTMAVSPHNAAPNRVISTDSMTPIYVSRGCGRTEPCEGMLRAIPASRLPH